MTRCTALWLLLFAACRAAPFPATVPTPAAEPPALPIPRVDRAELRAVCRGPGFGAAFSLVAASRGGDELRLAALDDLGGTLFAAVHAAGRVEVRTASPRLPPELADTLTLALAAALRPPELAAVRLADGTPGGYAARGDAQLLYGTAADGVRIWCGRAGRLLATVDLTAGPAGLGVHFRDVASGTTVDAAAVGGPRGAR